MSSIVKNVASSDIGATIEEYEVEPDLEFECSEDDDSDDSEEEGEDDNLQAPTQKRSFFSSVMKSISINKALTRADLEPILAQLRDHLIAKNVASEIATKLCDSVCSKLEGQHINTWLGLKSYVRNALEESMLRILSPNRNLNILGDIRAKQAPPYVITFCGVNGVGKSTNLAKIANWLVVTGNKVLVIACDTFRAGAIEQLRTHVTALKTIHERDGKKKIDLYEKGYGKDSAAIAMEAINYARTSGYNVCLVDTAGRMQDNEPLMKQLAKLIKINEPDLTLFVGEALVGNEAVDQLEKFNTALLDNGCRGLVYICSLSLSHVYRSLIVSLVDVNATKTERFCSFFLSLSFFSFSPLHLYWMTFLQSNQQFVCYQWYCSYKIRYDRRSSWCSHFDDIHYRPTNCIRWSWSDLSRSETTEC